RHDPCILIRVRPVIEAMAAMVMLDALLMKSASSL
ncbi:MAG TPA: chorismate synthase, partial [Muribaculaceae bacterium]|nr:chorismate synthase [Muribaculaceae bacterium]